MTDLFKVLLLALQLCTCCNNATKALTTAILAAVPIMTGRGVPHSRAGANWQDLASASLGAIEQ